jgi:peptide/nickel transport system permease protein
MLKLIANRLGQGVVTLFAVSVLIFVCTQILPGDVASAVLGQGATPEALAAFRKELGLNSVGLGILAAINEGKLIDRASNILTLITISIPEFFIAYLMIIYFVVDLGWFPSLATVYPGISFSERVYITTLPAVALTMLVAAHMLRMTRSSVLSVMSSPYIEMAFLKGAKRTRVISRHALPNAAAPIITVIALNLAYLVVGVVVLEAVFVYPGIGQLMVDAVSKRDVPVIQACGLVFAMVFVVLNTLADIAIILVNPRLRHKR